MSNQTRFAKCAQEICVQGPIVTDSEGGEIMCGSCGAVLVEKIVERDYSQYIFTKDSITKTRFGPKLKLSFIGIGLSTVINSHNTDSSGKQLSGKMRSEFYRLRKWDSQSKSKKKNQIFNEPFDLLDGVRSKLGLSELVVEKSAYIYRKAVLHNLIRGRSRPLLISASIYAACRSTNTPRTLKDIANAANVTKKMLQKTYMLLVKNLGLILGTYDPIDFITRLSTAVNVHEKTRRYAICLLQKAQKMEIIAGRNPIGIASAALYWSCVNNNESVSPARIAEAAGVTSVTIRNGYQHLQKNEIAFKE